MSHNIQNRKAIIIGATGRIGQALTSELCSLYSVVYVIARTPPKYLHENMHVYTLSNFDNLADIMYSVSLDEYSDAFCCLWTEVTSGREAITKVHFDYPITFAQICHQQGVRRLFMLSKLGMGARLDKSILQAREALVERLGSLMWQNLVFFMVDKVTLPKDDHSLKMLGKKMMRYARELLPSSHALSPSEIGMVMALVAFATLHNPNYLKQPDKGARFKLFKAKTQSGIDIINHEQMVALALQ